MSNYQAPMRDMQFLLHEVFNAEKLWSTMPAVAELIDKDTVDAILSEGAKLTAEAIAPLNRNSDEQGATWANGEVTTPDGFNKAYQLYCDGGWGALSGDPEYGGMGMPKMLQSFVEEMTQSASISFALYPMLTAGASLALSAHASTEMKQTYLENMYSGKWAGTMCLTEPHAGSDLGIMSAKAEAQDDGSFALSGTKIFITGGEQDLTENIIHLVLAKIPGAPEGPRGISMFVVPKFLLNDDGSLGVRNTVTCGSIEHKMGIKGSATCVMNFDGAKGYLVGELNKGLACMFTMMNFERIGVGIQGLGAAVRSYQNALEYAKDRIQGRSLSGVKSPDAQADSLLVHGDVRRMLLNMKAMNEGSRALSTYIAMQLDIATYGSGEAQQKADQLVALMTPIAKAFFTDLGFESTVAGQQVFGGHGYVREWGQEQLVRDTRISQIYEGTNGVQAMDLLARKVAGSKGQLVTIFLEEVRSYIEEQKADTMQEFIQPLAKATDELADLTEYLLTAAASSKEELGCAANDYLHVFGYTAMAYIWARMAEVSLAASEDSAFHQSKIHTARYFFSRLLPRCQSLITSAKSGQNAMFDMDEELF